MLIIVDSLKDITFGQLMSVYEEENRKRGKQEYPDLSGDQQLLYVEQDFYQYLRECFFSVTGSFYAIWEEDHRYVSALRIEPYRDGLLVAGLETAPQYRRLGYGTLLLSKTLEQLQGVRLYSHVEKRNRPSLGLHAKCGFQKMLNYGVYSDGSVRHDTVTLFRDL